MFKPLNLKSHEIMQSIHSYPHIPVEFYLKNNIDIKLILLILNTITKCCNKYSVLNIQYVIGIYT